MSFRRTSAAAVHQSDSPCLRRFRWDTDNPQPGGEAATKGNLLHEAIELYTYRQAEVSGIDPLSVVREVLHRHLHDDDATDEVVRDVVEIAATMFGPKSEIDFTLPASRTVVPEWRWALDDDFRPLVAKGDGWDGDVAHEGTIDRLIFGGGMVDVWDWKSALAMESSAEQEQDRQGRRYAVAVIETFDPKPKKVRWHKAFLRYGRAASWWFDRNEPWYEATKASMRAARAKRLRAIETDVWPESPGPACPYCPLYWNQCETLRKRRASGVDPSEPLSVQANIFIALKVGVTDLEKRLRAHVAATQEPIPLGNDDGEALGMKPVAGARMAISYEVAMERLGLLLSPTLTEDERAAWFAKHFRYVTQSNLASRVKAAASELLGRKTAHGLLFSEFEPWLLEETDFEFGVHTPEPRVERREMTPEEFDDFLDERLGG